jgi:hypothetical protein
MTDPVFDALWKKVLDDFDDERAHGAFIEHCEVADKLLEAAVRYRGMAGDVTRGPIAEKRLKAITALALTRLETARTPERPSGAIPFRIVLIVFFLLGSAALLYAFYR